MRIPVSYKYQNYPFSPKATGYSRSLGIFTSWFGCLCWGFLWFAAVGYFPTCCGVPENISYTLGLISLVLYVYLIRKFKKKMTEKIQKIALQDLMELQKTNPQEFMKYVNH